MRKSFEIVIKFEFNEEEASQMGIRPTTSPLSIGVDEFRERLQRIYGNVLFGRFGVQSAKLVEYIDFKDYEG